MQRPTCAHCHLSLPQVKKGATNELLCKACFVKGFEDEVYSVCQKHSLFSPGDRIVIGVSGGKDSSALLHCIYRINERYNMGLNILLLAIDEGIKGYRDDSLECVKIAEQRYHLPLKIISYDDIYEGWTMDKIVTTIGGKQNCTYCGILRRQALERGARELNGHKLVTGHNADDSVETILMNVLRGDFQRLQKCSSVITSGHSEFGGLPRVKPFYYSSEKDVVLYCHFEKLIYFSTECTYSPNAFRGHVRALVKQVESRDPSFMRKMLLSFDSYMMHFPSQDNSSSTTKSQQVRQCTECGLPSLDIICKACHLLKTLNSRDQHHHDQSAVK